MPTPLRILIICNEWPSLSETFIRHQAENLLERGHAVHIAAFASDAVDPAGPLENPNLHIHLFPRIPKKPLARSLRAISLACGMLHRNPRALRASFDKQRFPMQSRNLRLLYKAVHPLQGGDSYDIVHCHFGMAGETFRFFQYLGWLPSSPMLLSFHGCDATSHPRKYGKDIYKDTLPLAQVVTANSRWMAETARSLGCPPEKIHVFKSFVPFKGIVFKARTPTDGNLRIAGIGRLVEKKGFHVLVDAIASLRRSDWPVSMECRIAGGGPLERKLRDQVAEAGLNDSVRLLGWSGRREIAELLDWADVFVAPSVTAPDGDMEGQGVVLQEAQAAGLPVIASEHNGFPESMIPGKSGFLFPEGDPESLAKRIREIYDQRETWPAMGRVGHQFVMDVFHPDKLTSQLLDLYQLAIRDFHTDRRDGEQPTRKLP